MTEGFTERDRAILNAVYESMIRFVEFRASHDSAHKVIDKRLDDHSAGIKQLSVRWYGIAGSLATALLGLGYLLYEVIRGSR